MNQFDIIGALNEFATSKGWSFLYGFDSMYRNNGVLKEFTPDEIILIADFQADPSYINGKIPEITYTCLLMLGRKSESSGTFSNLDETSQQKYDRRLLELVVLLGYGIAEFGCVNDLEITSAPIVVNINVFDTNIDFAISQNATFVQ